MYGIGIDIGTTSICGVLLDTETGKIIKSRTENSEAFISTPNSWEKIQDVEKIIKVATGILEDLICDGVCAIGVTGQMHGIVYLDKDGKAISPLYTWQDARGNLPYKDTTYAGYLNSCAGYGNVTDFYNRENGIRPENAVSHCTIHDYLVMVLTGRKTPLLHTSDAASLGCFDINTLKYSNGFDVDVTGDFTIAGEYKGIPVSVAIGDNQASVFSTLADENNLLINVGTGSQISIVSDKIIEGEGIECRPYFDGKYLIVGAALCGGRAFSVLKDFFTKVFAEAEVDAGRVYTFMDKMLAKYPLPENPLAVDTRFDGTRANPKLRGSISNIGIDNFGPVELTYGVLCGMVNELYQMYKVMDSERFGIVGSGNGVRHNKAFMIYAEQTFGGKLRLPVHVEEAAYGATLYALVASGVKASSAEAQKLIKYE